MSRLLLVCTLLTACGPTEEERQQSAERELTKREITDATLTGKEGRYTFSGQRFDGPCEGEVLVDEPAGPVVKLGQCAPDADSAEATLNTRLSAMRMEDITLTGVGGDRVGVTATLKGDACAGEAVRRPWGALDAKVKCGATTYTTSCAKADRPPTEAEKQALWDHVRPAIEARGLTDASLDEFGCYAAFTGIKGGEPCHGKLQGIAPDEELEVKLDKDRCPGALPPPEALADLGQYVAWFLTEKPGYTDVEVQASGQAWCVKVTVEGQRFAGSAIKEDDRIRTQIKGGTTKVEDGAQVGVARDMTFWFPAPKDLLQGHPSDSPQPDCPE